MMSINSVVILAILLLLILFAGIGYFTWFKIGQRRWTEASAEAELEWLPTMLAKVSPLVDAGFTAREEQWLMENAMQMVVEQQKDFRFQVQYHGATVPLIIRLFMADIELVNIYFFTVPALASQLQMTMSNTLDTVESAAFSSTEYGGNGHD